MEILAIKFRQVSNELNEVTPMPRKEMFQIAALVTLIFGVGFVSHWLTADPHKTTSAKQTTDEPESIRHAEAEYETAMKYESLGDLDHAMEQYERLKKSFPNHPTIDYSIGICKQKQGKTAEAVEAFRRIAAVPDGPKEITEDAKARVQKLQSPQLTPTQQTYLDLAIEYLKTGEDLKELTKEQTPPPTPPSNAHVLPLEHSVRYLDTLRQEKPDYIPLYFRLGIAYEFLGRHLDAYYAYFRYLHGYQQLKIPFGNQEHEIRRRLLVCETTLGLGLNQFFVKSYDASGQFVTHRAGSTGELAELSLANSPEDQLAAKLKVIPGIAEQTDISLESLVKPNHFLRPTAPGLEVLTFSPAIDEPTKKESVFKVGTGLGTQEKGWISFESRSRPNWFIISSPDKKLFLRAKADTDAFRRSATFRLLGPSNPGLPVKP